MTAGITSNRMLAGTVTTDDCVSALCGIYSLLQARPVKAGPVFIVERSSNLQISWPIGLL